MNQDQNTTLVIVRTLEAERPASPTDSDTSSVSSFSSNESGDSPQTYVNGEPLKTIPEAVEEESKYNWFRPGSPLSAITEEDEQEDEEQAWPFPNVKQQVSNTDKTQQAHERSQALQALTRLTPPASPSAANYSVFPTTPEPKKTSLSSTINLNDSRFRAREPDGPLNSNPLSARERRASLKAARRRAGRQSLWKEGQEWGTSLRPDFVVALPSYTCDKGPDWEPMDLLEFVVAVPLEEEEEVKVEEEKEEEEEEEGEEED